MLRNVKGSILLGMVLSIALLAGGCGASSDHVNTGTDANTKSNAGTTSPSPGAGSASGDSAGANASDEDATDGDRTLTDALGHAVKMPAHPQRILASYLEDPLVALGVKPVAQWSVSDGKSVQNYLQEALQGVPTIPSDLPYEAVMSFKPDLIIMDSAEMVAGDKYDQYAKIAPTYTIGTEQNNDWRQELLTIGDLLDKRGEAQNILDEYDRKVQDAKAQLKQAVGTDTVAILWVTAKQVYVPSVKLSSGDVLYRDLELTAPQEITAISETATANWNPISMEKLAEADIDYLFLVNSKGVTKEELLKDPVWANIPAVKNGRVYEYDTTASWLYTGAIANGQMIDNVLKSILNH